MRQVTLRETECRHFPRMTSSKERQYDDSGGAGFIAKCLLVDVAECLCTFYYKFMTMITSDFMT